MSFFKNVAMPHVFILITGVILVCCVLTYVVPSGSYERQTVTIDGSNRSVVVPDTYTSKPKHMSAKGVVLEGKAPEGKAAPSSLHGFLMAIPRGMEKSADIIFFIFLIGGVFGILQRSGVITAMVHLILDLFGHWEWALIPLIMLVLAIGGSTLGMGEEFIPLVPIFLLVSQRLGYDRVVGLSIVVLGAQVGFAAATFNPFTIGVAKGIAELPMGNGLLFRGIFFLVSFAISVAYLLYYAHRVKRDPKASVVYDEPVALEEGVATERFDFRHFSILVVCVVLFCIIIYGTVNLGWWMAEMSGGFLLMGIFAAAIGKLTLGDASDAFVKGMGEMVVAALVVGFARGIEVVLSDAQVLDTLVYSAATVLNEVPKFVAVQGMFVFQSMLNFLIPSGSGQAAVTMPLMAPLADVLGVTRETAVFAFQCGDGFSNTIIPTSGILMAMLALAKVSYGKWLRFMLPLFLILSVNAMIFLAIAVAVNLN